MKKRRKKPKSLQASDLRNFGWHVLERMSKRPHIPRVSTLHMYLIPCTVDISMWKLSTHLNTLLSY